MPFTREFVRSTAKECGLEIPKEFEDALVQEHLAARTAYAEKQVKAWQDEHPEASQPNVKESQEYKDLKKEFETYKSEISAKEARAAKESAYRELLKSAGVSEKRIDTVLRVSDLDCVEIADGKIKDADKLMQTIKTEWADFITSEHVDGAHVDTPPAGGASEETDLGSLSMAEYIAARTKK